jgi:hypothetical protein
MRPGRFASGVPLSDQDIGEVYVRAVCAYVSSLAVLVEPAPEHPRLDHVYRDACGEGGVRT